MVDAESPARRPRRCQLAAVSDIGYNITMHWKLPEVGQQVRVHPTSTPCTERAAPISGATRR